MFYSLWLSQVAQHRPDIGIEQDGLIFQSSHGDGLTQVDAGISGLGILSRHTQKRHFDDAGGIAADAKFQEQNAAVPMPTQKNLIPPGRGMPAFILHKAVVTAQIHGHRLTALGAVRDQLQRDTHFRLLCDHSADSSLVIISGLMAQFTALPEAVIALGVEQPRLIKTCQLKLMVHIGGQDEVIPAPDQFQQVGIRLAGRHIVTVTVDMPAPPSPVFLQRGKGIESAGIHIGDAVLLMEVREVFQKTFAAIGQTGRSGKAGARANEDGVCTLDLSFQPLDFL